MDNLREAAISAAERLLSMNQGEIRSIDSDGKFEIDMIKRAALIAFYEDLNSFDVAVIRFAIKEIMTKGEL